MGQGSNLLNPFLNHRKTVKDSRGAFSRNREGAAISRLLIRRHQV